MNLANLLVLTKEFTKITIVEETGKIIFTGIKKDALLSERDALRIVNSIFIIENEMNIMVSYPYPYWAWRKWIFTITGEALEFFKDFIKYAELDMEAMADLMYYDYEGFKRKLVKLKKQLKGVI